MILFLFLQIEWQATSRPYDKLQQELIINFSIPSNKFRYITEDSLFFAEYESQLKVRDTDGNQLVGDYWEKRIAKDTLDIEDSVKILIPKDSKYFELRIVDLNGGQIFMIAGEVLQIKYLGDIQWRIANDTLMVSFSIINPDGEVDKMTISIDDISETEALKTGNYDDTVSLYVGLLPMGNYILLFEMFTKTIRIDEVKVPIRISKPFYLDDSTWSLKVEQLRYIATPSEMKSLRESEVAERDSLWRRFWAQYDPTPSTEHNEEEVEYFARIEYCEQKFSHGDRGWRSDRAKVYVKYGPPDEIQSMPYYNPPRYSPQRHFTVYDAYEVWYYYRLNRQYVFGDRHGFGQYDLLNPSEYN